MPTYYPSHDYGPAHAAAFGATPKPEISEKQLAANRANAQKSTGPKTEEGKARSSRNAFRHGLTGHVSVNTDEDRAAHELFCQPLIADLKPEGALEQQIAISIAEQHWRLNRARAMEDNIFALGDYGPAGDFDAEHPELHAALTAASVFLESSRQFESLTLYEQRIHRTLEKDMAKLEQLQAKRKAETDAALEEAVKRAKVAEFSDEPAEREMEVNGFKFSKAQIAAKRSRIDRLKRFDFHEKHRWDREIEYPEAA